MNIVITGASSGLGDSLSQKYAQQNNILLLIARNKINLEKTKKTCQDQGAKVETAICDVRDKKKLEKILLEFDKKHPVDLIIANAGISAGTSKGDEKYQQIKDIFDINIFGVVNSIYPLIENFQKRKKGHIAIISSMSGFRGLPQAPAYSTSKAAVRFFAEAIRGEFFKDNIKVTTICPGYIKTPMTDANNFPMPFLISSKKASNLIAKAIAKNKTIVIFPKIIYYFLQFTKILPNSLSDKLFNAMPKK